MKWSFNGFREWPAGEGQLGLLEGFDVFAASDVAALGRGSLFVDLALRWNR